MLRLQEFDFLAHYVSGIENIADYFLRYALYGVKITNKVNLLTIMNDNNKHLL